MALMCVLSLVLAGIMSPWLSLPQSPALAEAVTMPPMASTTKAHHSHPHHLGRAVCYLAGWAHHRPDPVQFHPEDLDTSLCTHVIFAFALLDSSGLHLVPAEQSDPQMYQRLTKLKRERPNMKVLLSVGGWKMGSKEFTKTVSSTSNMYVFAQNAVEYLHRYNFDGLDVDWEYPADRGSPAGDKQRFTAFLDLLRREFQHDHVVTRRPILELSVAIAPAPSRVRASYQLPAIAQYVDFINVMTYDLHGQWDHAVGHHTPLYSPSEDETDSIDYMVNWILNTTIPKQKLNLGLAFYGISFNMTDPLNAQLGAPSNGPGAAGSLTGEKGILAYYEVCQLLTEHNDTVSSTGRLPNSQSPYVVDGTRWTGYDDAKSIKEKVDYAAQMGLGGVAIWSIDLDDFHGICGEGHYPLMHAIRQQMHTSIIG